MLNNQVMRSLFVIIVLIVVTGCVAATPPGGTNTPIKVEPISLTVSPNVARLNHGDRVTIQINSDKWAGAELNWSVTTDFDFTGEIEQIDDLTLIYQAPQQGQGLAVISVAGRTGDAEGFGQVSLVIE
jgi:hypothetical protein